MYFFQKYEVVSVAAKMRNGLEKFKGSNTEIPKNTEIHVK